MLELATCLELSAASSLIIVKYCREKSKSQKPIFPNLTDLTFKGDELDGRITPFTKWFSNLKSFSLRSINLYNPKCIKVTLPILRKLEITNNHSAAFRDFDTIFISSKNGKKIVFV